MSRSKAKAKTDDVQAQAVPAGLIGDAAKRWAAVAPILAARGPVDVESLTTYCQVWARWREVEGWISQAGSLTKSGAGTVIASPLVAISNTTEGKVRRLEKQLGIGGAVVQAGKNGHEEPLLTRKELAAAMGVHMMTITKWEQRGMPTAVVGKKGLPSQYRERQTREWLAASEAETSKAGLVDVAKERARKERAQAAVSEQTFQMRAGHLVPQEEVEKAWAAEVNAARTLALQCPAQYKDRVFNAATLGTADDVQRILNDMIHELLRELGNPNRTIDL